MRPSKILLAFALVALPVRGATAKTNVLYLIADDLNCQLGCYGAEGMKTPNIDGLATRGVLFDRVYCQVPSCNPSRTSFLTGRRPNQTKVWLNPGGPNPYPFHFRTYIPDTVTLPQLFKNQGWFSARVGKAFHYGVPMDIGTSSLDDFPSWDQVVNPRGRDRDNEDAIVTLKPKSYAGTISWLCDDEGSDAEQTDGVGAREAIALLERFKAESKPFFLVVGFYRPHTPFVAPQQYFDLYPLEKISVPPLSADDRSRTPGAAYASSHPEEDGATDLQRRQAIQAYHASVSFMDAQVGRVLAALDRLGLTRNTIIVFSSDHGYHLGDHGLWQKDSLFERATHLPLIISLPDAKARSQVAHGIVEMLDLYPTLADLCGLAAPNYIEGVSLRPALIDPKQEVQKAAFSQSRRRATGRDGYSVRSGRWRYTEWDLGNGMARQLFDEEADPAEATNLAETPQHATVVAELHTLIETQRPHQ